MGRFTFRDLPACRATLEATQSGYLDGTYGQRRPGLGLGTPVAILDGQAVRGLTFRLAPAGAISGQVLNQYGEPARGVRVEALLYVMTPNGRDLRSAGQAQADDRGTFRVFGLAPGNYVVRASIAPAEIPTRGQPQARAPQAAPVCQLSTGDPLAASVYFPGTTSYANAAHITLGPSEDYVGAVIRYPEISHVSIQGRLTNPGAPVSEVRAFLLDADACVAFAVTDSRGAFSVGPVPVGRYRLEIRAPGRTLLDSRSYGDYVAQRSGPMFWSSTEILATEDKPVVVQYQLEPGLTVRGTVFTDTGPWTAETRGTLPRGPVITLEAQTGAGSPAYQVTTGVNDDGRFEFIGVPPGRYRITGTGSPTYGFPVLASGGANDALDVGVEVPASGQVPTVALTYSAKGTRIDGQMVSESSRPGPPESPCYVVMFSRNPSYWTPLSRRVAATVPDALGQFTFRSLPAGDYFLSAFRGDEPEMWSDAQFLGRLRRDAEVTLTSGNVSGPVQLSCK
jgi:hypothetical protein